MNSIDVIRGRAQCPKCKRKGVGYAGHPHAFGYKDFNRARCRYCRATFQRKKGTNVPLPEIQSSSKV